MVNRRLEDSGLATMRYVRCTKNILQCKIKVANLDVKILAGAAPEIGGGVSTPIHRLRARWKDIRMSENEKKVSVEAVPAKAAPAPKAVPELKFVTAEVPQVVRKLAEQSVTKAKDTYEVFKTAAENASGAIEDSVTSASKGATALNRQIIGAIKDTATAQFDLVSDLAGVRTPAEAIELHNRFMRARMDALTSRSQAIARLVGEITIEAAKPIRENAARTFDVIADAR